MSFGTDKETEAQRGRAGLRSPGGWQGHLGLTLGSRPSPILSPAPSHWPGTSGVFNLLGASVPVWQWGYGEVISEDSMETGVPANVRGRMAGGVTMAPGSGAPLGFCPVISASQPLPGPVTRQSGRHIQMVASHWPLRAGRMLRCRCPGRTRGALALTLLPASPGSWRPLPSAGPQESGPEASAHLFLSTSP